ncbi:MAG: PQQ-binding-like beta-propeller repeat protein, partial [Planctomycetaceae bacterium]
SQLSAAELDARDVLVELLCGDRVRAHEMRIAFHKRHPDSQGHLAGRDERLGDILQDVWTSESHCPPCRGGLFSAERADDVDCTITIGGPLWRLPLTCHRSAERVTNRPMLSGVEPPEVLPSISEGRVFWATETAVQAVRMDGQPVWPVGPESRDHRLYSFTMGAGRKLDFPRVGQACHRIALDAGRLFAQLGDPVAVAAERESRQMESQLVCLDVQSGQGKLLWTRFPEDLFTDRDWRLSGGMLATNGQLLITARRSQPSQGVAVACLSAATGEQLWFKLIAGILAEAPATWHLSASDTLMADEDQVYLVSGAGVTAALDRRSGQLQWVLQDDPQPWRIPPLTPVGEQSRQAAVLSRGLLYTIQQDGRTVQCLETATGAARWQQRLPVRVQHLLGVRCGVLAAVGQQSWGLNQDTGEIRWRAGYDDVAGEFVGRGLLVGQTLLACNHEELWEVDLPTGTIQRRHPLWEAFGVRGGHLLLGPGGLVIASEREFVTLRVTEP